MRFTAPHDDVPQRRTTSRWVSAVVLVAGLAVEHVSAGASFLVGGGALLVVLPALCASSPARTRPMHPTRTPA